VVAVPTQAQAAPNFKAPFPCGQRWTYSHHQLLNGVGQNIVINGGGLSYPGDYGSAFLTSDNACGSQPGKPFMTWGSGVRVRSPARPASSATSTSTIRTQYCQAFRPVEPRLAWPTLGVGQAFL
jgi:hypothetical protein